MTKPRLLAIVCLVTVVLMPFRLWAQRPYAVLSNSSSVLTFYYDDQMASRNGLSVGPFNKVGFQSWYAQRDSVTKVVFDPSFANCNTIISTAYWFFEMKRIAAIEGLERLNTSKVTNMFSMFAYCNSLTELDVSHFDTHDVVSLAGMFTECSSLTSLDVSRFDTRNATDMSYMFDQCSGLTSLDVSHFNTSNVTSMERMFNHCSALTALNVSGFDTRNVTNMFSMFNDCSSLTSLDVSHFNTEKVENMGSMFTKCSGLASLDVSHFDTRNVARMGLMFDGCSLLTTLDISNFDTSNVVDMGNMFQNCTALTTLDLSRFVTSKVTNMGAMFAYCPQLTTLDVSHFDTQKVTNMWCMFGGCTALVSLDVSHFRTDSVTNMNCMFHKCNSLTAVDVSGFNTERVVDMGYMFSGCSTLTSLDVSHFKTDSVKMMHYMFVNCDRLTELDVSHFNTDNVTTMEGMFYNCSGLTALDVSHFQTGKVTDMSFMFYKCNALTALDLSHFDTSSVLTMESMFDDCRSLTVLDLTNFNTQNVRNMFCMFYDCANLTTIFAGDGWSTAKLVSDYGLRHIDGRKDMFTNCTSLIGGNGTRYDKQHTNSDYARIDKSDSPGYLSDRESPYIPPDSPDNPDNPDNPPTPPTPEIEPYAVLSAGNSVLTFYYDNQREQQGGLEVGPFSQDATWAGHSQEIGKVVFAESFADCTSITSTRHWFHGLRNLTAIEGLEHLNTSGIADMGYMFCGCASLTSLDLSSFDTKNVKVMDYMLADCASLVTVYATDSWTTEAVTNGSNMFTGSTRLVGGNGTTYTHTDYLYARIDKPTEPGYFTDKNGSVAYVTAMPVATLDYATGSLAITCATAGSTIHYAIGTSEPQDYAGPIMLTDNSTVRIWATASGYAVSSDTIIKPIRNGSADGSTFRIDGVVTGRELLFLRNVLGHSVEHLDMEDATLTDGGLADEAFARMPLLTAQLPKAVGSTGDRLFTGCRRLAAVIWNAPTDMTESAMEGIGNPNLLFYVGSEAIGSQAGIGNRIVAGIAQTVTLADASSDAVTDGNFFCPRTFTARRISYTHQYGLQSGYAECSGWETLALPFDVQTIVHDNSGKTVTPFAAYNGNTDDRPFWLCELTPGGWRETARVEAYKPYIIAMPNNDTYSDQYILSGNVTFSAEDATVGTTPNPKGVAADGSRFVPTMTALEASDTVFVLNRTAYERHPAGSVFVAALRGVKPFEAWRTTTQQGVRCLPVFADMPSAITDVERLRQNRPQTVYDLQGRKLNATGRKGIYVVNGRKVVVK